MEWYALLIALLLFFSGVYWDWFARITRMIRRPISRFFDWNSHIAEIEKCAKENGVLEINLPKKEWERLKAEKLASLKSILSANAFSRLILLDDSDPERYYLLVAHLGSCR